MLAKNVKNDVEAEGMLQSHIRDAVALCKFAAQLEEEIPLGKEWTELSASVLLAEYRSQQKNNMGTSFTSIAAFGTNSAVIHYTASEVTDTKIDTSSVFLCK
jgi:Xaa-Pro aminopeptidase